MSDYVPLRYLSIDKKAFFYNRKAAFIKDPMKRIAETVFG
jgi:hypothetical protein